MRRHTARPKHYSLEMIGIFGNLSAKALERIQRDCCWQRYEPGEAIVNYLDLSDDVFFITAGEVRVTIYSKVGKVVSFADLGIGEVFGEYAAVDHRPRSASVEARTSCLIASMTAASFLTVLQTEPAVTLAVLTQLVSRTRSVMRRVYELSTLQVSVRIQAELLREANLASQNGKSARIVPAPTHADIANRISTNREAVTREIKRLIEIGIIKRSSDSLWVGDIEHLAQMIHEATGELVEDDRWHIPIDFRKK